jgi:hypothetical protein
MISMAAWRSSGSRAGLVVALAASALLAGASAAAAQCGQDYHGAPPRSNTAGGPPLAVGDSVLADAVPILVRDGFEADGVVCRQMSQGLALLRERGAALPHLVVLALGTNGGVTPAEVDSALAILGPRRVLALVTPHGSVVPSTPAVIRAAAAAHPGRILLLDWDRLVASHADWLAPDGVHLGGQAGIEAFAAMIASVLPGAAAPAAEAAGSPETPGAPITIQPSATSEKPAAKPHPAARRPRPTQAATARAATARTAAGSTSASAPPVLNATGSLGPAKSSARIVAARSPYVAFAVIVALVIAGAAMALRLRRR